MNEIALTFIGLFAMIAVGVWARYSLKPEDVTKKAASLLAEARVKALDHRIAYEHHKALSDMYTLRAKHLAPKVSK